MNEKTLETLTIEEVLYLYETYGVTVEISNGKVTAINYPQC